MNPIRSARRATITGAGLSALFALTMLTTLTGCPPENPPPRTCGALGLCVTGYRWDDTQCQCVKAQCDGAAIDCSQNYYFSPDTCSCVCAGPTPCPQGDSWSDSACSCVHPICDPPGPCPDGQSWNSETCSCVGDVCTSDCVIGKHHDNSCACVCNAVASVCPLDAAWDDTTCQCQPPPSPECASDTDCHVVADCSGACIAVDVNQPPLVCAGHAGCGDPCQAFQAVCSAGRCALPL